MVSLAVAGLEEDVHNQTEEYEDLLDNIDGHIQGPTQGNDSTWPPDVKLHKPLPSYAWLKPYDESSTEAFCQWLSRLELDVDNEIHLKSWEHHFSGEAVELSLTHQTSSWKASKQDELQQCLAIGRYCPEATSNYKTSFLEFCMQARKVFLVQPTRLFLRGIYVHGSLAEAWVFDRSSLRCLEQVDIIVAPLQLSSMLYGFRKLTKHELGVSSLVQYDGSNMFIELTNDKTSQLDRLYLDEQPIALSEDLIGGGTTCYRARTSLIDTDASDLVVKFKWRLASDKSEEEMLKLAEGRGASGVLCLRYEKVLCSTSQFYEQRQNLACRRFCTFPDSSEHKPRDMDEVPNAHGSDSVSRGVLAWTEETKQSFQDRILTLVVLSPVGRPLRSFRDAKDLLLALRDAVKAHRSLLQTASILHQDISSGNIIIIDPERQDGRHSVLIDLDVAIDLSKTRSEPGSIIGTRPYMAVGVLLGRRHTYRHDLESFLHVLVRTIIADGAENPPPGSRIRRWGQGEFSDIAKLKLSDMEEKNFCHILAEFPARYGALKSLAEELRQLLFPVVDGRLWTATDGSIASTNALYDGVIGAFDKYAALENS